MPAAGIAKGIILSISIITALSLAVLENPQVQAWLEEQRHKIAELLRSIGEELDPQSRRTAEAFAFEGRTDLKREASSSNVTDAGLKREASGSKEAAAVATGMSLSSASTIRRIPVQGPTDPDEAEERRRKGREYLAKRNQQMYELQQRRKAEKGEGEGAITPPTPTSFDAIVDDEGKLRLPDAPSADSVPENVKAEMREVERNLSQPLLVGEASSSGWSFGSQLANPFSDEYALDRSGTPKPPVPPKVALDSDDSRDRRSPWGFTPRPVEAQPVQAEERREDLSYEEQLAIALSLSEAEAAAEAARSANATAARQNETEEDDPDLRAAIEASLKEMNSQKAANIVENDDPKTPRLVPENLQPLVDLTPPSPTLPPRHPFPRGPWETLFNQDYSPTHEPLSLARPASETDEDDELYRVTPDLSRARLAPLGSPPSSTTHSSIPYDPVREAANHSQDLQQGLLEASFYSAASSAPSPASTHTMDHEPTPLIDISEDVPDDHRTPTSQSSFGFQTDTDSDSDTFASVSGPSRDQSQARSEISNVDLVDVVEDSDVDMLSEEGDGVATPDSWTEVGSRDGESEMDEDEPRQRAAL